MSSPDECAKEVLDLIPVIMRTIRSEMRRQRKMGLSVPEFRALAYVSLHPATSLSEVAEHVGTPLPSMSKMIDGLVNQKLVHRETSPEDRRKITLVLTPVGKSMLQQARKNAQANLARHLDRLSPQECMSVVSAMAVLKKVFPTTSVDQDEAVATEAAEVRK